MADSTKLSSSAALGAGTSPLGQQLRAALGPPTAGWTEVDRRKSWIAAIEAEVGDLSRQLQEANKALDRTLVETFRPRIDDLLNRIKGQDDNWFSNDIKKFDKKLHEMAKETDQWIRELNRSFALQWKHEAENRHCENRRFEHIADKKGAQRKLAERVEADLTLVSKSPLEKLARAELPGLELAR